MKLPPHIKGLIFDCDGTLADTMPLHWRAWQMVTRRHGLYFPEDRFYAFGGVPSRDILKQLAAEQGPRWTTSPSRMKRKRRICKLSHKSNPFTPWWKLPGHTGGKSPWPSLPAAPSKSSTRSWNI